MDKKERKSMVFYHTSLTQFLRTFPPSSPSEQNRTEQNRTELREDLQKIPFYHNFCNQNSGPLLKLDDKVAADCLQLHGGWGFMWETNIAKAYASARVQVSQMLQTKYFSK